MPPHIPEPATSDHIAERLRSMMQKQGITSTELARRAGIKTSFIYDLLRGKSRNPSIIRLSRVAEVLDIPIAYLTAMQDHTFSAQHITPVPCITGSGPARSVNFSSDWLAQHFKQAEALKFYTICDDRMAPTLLVDDTVLVDQSQTELQSTGIYMVHTTGTLSARRLNYDARTQQVQLVCDNPAYLAEKLPLADITLAGRVVWYSRFV